ncbi:HlyD family secretion protein [Flavobacterium sp. YO12]|uniref:HlyD family secretion protein n=1 Tax=Flavobacterium sp. YO12 TaxID=1920029 RepID=UPI00100B84CA|nr:HlyD family efflux transporter periplasmic adaptor subunit [Flavobacterium sp. YO12]RXM42300.1 HlyD family secretion protein [Flavobacterium sp. YO12]
MIDNKEIELRSEEIQEVLQRMPNWTIRYGSFIVFMTLLLLLFISWLVRYPDIITTQIIITTNIPPEKIAARISGKIEAILVSNNSNVYKGQPIAVIESSANYSDVFLLKSILDTIDISVERFPFEKVKLTQLGDIESSFAVFQKEYTSNELNKKLHPFKVLGEAQDNELIQLRERLKLLEIQESINQNEIFLLKEDLKRYESLFSKGIISLQELDRHKLEYLQAYRGHKSILSTISQTKSSVNELNKNSKTTKIEGEKEVVNLERSLIQSFYHLKNEIKNWELNHVFYSSFNGKISFLEFWSKNQVVNARDNVFTVLPAKKNEYIGKLKAAAQNSGKIKIGQEVNIRLLNYPDREFGMVRGIVHNISLIPDKDGNLLIDVLLPKGLLTSYNKRIKFQQEMIGKADIVTEDLRLLERLLYQFRDLFKH